MKFEMKYTLNRLALTSFVLLMGAWAHAGAFNLVRYIAPGQYSLGIEPEVTLSNGSGLGMNAHYSQGLTELSDLNVVLGSSGGPRKFRVGANVTLDAFPDIDQQPGMGIAAQAMYFRMQHDGGQLEVSAIPYIHKAFISAGQEVEPFLALPVGINFNSGTYTGMSALQVGALFKQNSHLRFVMELGVGINHSESSVSCGAVYTL